ncbi:MAG: hypothetical protein Fur0018_02050 [Anaerolineales bacterium]
MTTTNLLSYKIRMPRKQRDGTTPLTLLKPPVVVLLHAAGADENQLFALEDHIDDRFLVVSVRAPIEQGKDSFVWYLVSPFDVTDVNVANIRKGVEYLVRTIRHVLTRANGNPDEVFLLGVDQGAVMALSTILLLPKWFSGCMAFGGVLWGDVRYDVLERSALQRKPVFLGYGLHDNIIPLETARRTRELLMGFEMDVTYREYTDVTHSLQSRVLEEMLTWLGEQVERLERRVSRHQVQARMGYVELYVRNLERSMVFYQRFLGLRLAERVGSKYAFLSGSARHHDLTLFQVGTDALNPPRGAVGVAHIAFEVPDQRSFAQVYRRLSDAHIPVKTLDRLIAWTMTFADPDENVVEVYCDTRDLPGAADLWQGRDLPLPEEKILAALT